MNNGCFYDYFLNMKSPKHQLDAQRYFNVGSSSFKPYLGLGIGEVATEIRNEFNLKVLKCDA